MMKRLEEYPLFSIIAWSIVILGVWFTVSLVLKLNDVVTELEAYENVYIE